MRSSPALRGEPVLGDKKRWLGILGGIVGTSALLALCLLLGAWAYGYRRYSLHESRLRRLNEQRPNADLVTQALRAEGGILQGTARSGVELDGLLARDLIRGDRTVILSKAADAAEARVFFVGDMVYIIYFGNDQAMRDYVCVGR